MYFCKSVYLLRLIRLIRYVCRNVEQISRILCVVYNNILEKVADYSSSFSGRIT